MTIFLSCLRLLVASSWKINLNWLKQKRISHFLKLTSLRFSGFRYSWNQELKRWHLEHISSFLSTTLLGLVLCLVAEKCSEPVSSQVSFTRGSFTCPVTGPCRMPAPGLALYVYHFMKSPTSAYEIRASLTFLLEAKTLRLEEMSSKVALSVFDLHGAIPLL